MKVRATDQYEHPNIEGLKFVVDGVLKRVPKKGEVFEVDELRYKLLNGNNQYGLVFVEKIEEEIEVAKAPTPKKETTKKKTTTKKK